MTIHRYFIEHSDGVITVATFEDELLKRMGLRHEAINQIWNHFFLDNLDEAHITHHDQIEEPKE